MNYALILESSRKAKAVRQLYEQLKQNYKGRFLAEQTMEGYTIRDGIPVVQTQDKNRVINLRLQDEHLSPYMKTNMNLFHMLMLDEQVEIQFFKADNGWMIVYQGIQNLPKPFGTQGYDMR